jgi:hypothetical protein
LRPKAFSSRRAFASDHLDDVAWSLRVNAIDAPAVGRAVIGL